MSTDLEMLIRFFSHQRLRPSRYEREDLLQEVISDKNRIVFSNAYRRLQAKTQVFPLQQNDAVHTRLTHTAEVAILGQNIASHIGRALNMEHPHFSAFLLFMECVCLLHDIGNPPFGHFGEYAIRGWFKEHGEEIANLHNLDSGLLEDFLYFDGNPQGFRLISRLQSVGHDAGLNLTATVLGAYLKYLDCHVDSENRLKKKLGYFQSEKPMVDEIRRILSLGDEQRHPFTYIMEAADDIAYCLSDIEDGLEKAMFDYNFFCRNLNVLIEKELEGKDESVKEQVYKHLQRVLHDAGENPIDGGIFHFRTFKAELTSLLVKFSAESFSEHLDQILAGTMQSGISKHHPVSKALMSAIGAFARKHVYDTKEAIDVELSGYEVIVGILNRYKKLIMLSTEEFDRLDPSHPDSHKIGVFEIEKRLYHLMSRNQLRCYHECRNSKVLAQYPEPFHRMHLVVDFVAGMTDTYALKIFRILSGITTSVRDQ